MSPKELMSPNNMSKLSRHGPCELKWMLHRDSKCGHDKVRPLSILHWGDGARKITRLGSLGTEELLQGAAAGQDTPATLHTYLDIWYFIFWARASNYDERRCKYLHMFIPELSNLLLEFIQFSVIYLWEPKRSEVTWHYQCEVETCLIIVK